MIALLLASLGVNIFCYLNIKELKEDISGLGNQVSCVYDRIRTLEDMK